MQTLYASKMIFLSKIGVSLQKGVGTTLSFKTLTLLITMRSDCSSEFGNKSDCKKSRNVFEKIVRKQKGRIEIQPRVKSNIL